MFVGQQELGLDAKKRIVIPAKFRRPLMKASRGRELFVSLWPTQDFYVLCMFAREGWRATVERLEQSAKSSEQADLFKRFVGFSTERCHLDAQWRLQLPESLIAAAALGKKVIAVGAIERIEVWELGRFRDYEKNLAAQAAILSKQLYQPRPPMS